MRKIFLILMIALFQLNYSCAQDVSNDVIGEWELMELDLEGEDQATGVVRKFNSDGTCELKENSNILYYTYSISHTKCNDGSLDNGNNYMRLYNVSDNNQECCFQIDNIGVIDDIDNRVYMTLYTYGALKPNIFVKK
jgi:flagellar hook assembly protein FlgD